MASLTGIDAPIFRFSSDLSDLAVATGDGRVKIFNVAQQKLRADITQALSGSKGMDAKNDIHSCLDWSKQVSQSTIVYSLCSDLWMLRLAANLFSVILTCPSL